MPKIDPSPHGADTLPEPYDRPFPDPDPSERITADTEDEDADPVIDTGPGITDGVHGPKQQRG